MSDKQTEPETALKRQKFTEEDQAEMIRRLGESFSFMAVNDEKTNELLDVAAKHCIELGKLCLIAGGKRNESEKAYANIEQGFIWIKESMYRRVRDQAIENAPKEEKSNIIKPPGFNEK